MKEYSLNVLKNRMLQMKNEKDNTIIIVIGGQV